MKKMREITELQARCVQLSCIL